MQSLPRKADNIEPRTLLAVRRQPYIKTHNHIENRMIKIFHLSFILMSIISFVGKVIISETHPLMLKQKLFKIAPHVIDSGLLLSGILLVFQGQWLSTEHGWIIAKLLALLGYIGLGIVVMRHRGTIRWLAFTAAMLCFVYIGIVAATKNPLFFL